jgi:hypothetical protein
MYDSDNAEVTLRFRDDQGRESHMSGPMAVESFIRFEGVAVSFTQEPFMLTFNVSTSPPAGRDPVPRPSDQ